MTHKIIASAIIFNENNQVLLGKRSPDEEVFPGLWGIPGGRVEFSDTEPHVIEKNIAREVSEEFGIVIKPTRYLTSNFSKDGGKLYLIFVGEYVSGIPKPLEDTDEVRWFGVEECNSLEMTPHTLDNIHEAIRLSSKK